MQKQTPITNISVMFLCIYYTRYDGKYFYNFKWISTDFDTSNLESKEGWYDEFIFYLPKVTVYNNIYQTH